MLLHLHIPKTGGSSLITLLKRQYGDQYCRVPNWNQSTPSRWQAHWGDPQELRSMACISGHFYFGFWRALNNALPVQEQIEQPRFITFVRHPIDRLLSLYRYWQGGPNRYREDVIRMSFVEWSLGARPGLPFLDNDMVRRIAGVESIGHRVDDADLAQATEHLRYFLPVGLTDRFDETLCDWGKRLGWDDLTYERRLTQPDRLRREDLPDKALALLETRQRYDMALYRHCIDRDWGSA